MLVAGQNLFVLFGRCLIGLLFDRFTILKIEIIDSRLVGLVVRWFVGLKACRYVIWKVIWLIKVDYIVTGLVEGLFV